MKKTTTKTQAKKKSPAAKNPFKWRRSTSSGYTLDLPFNARLRAIEGQEVVIRSGGYVAAKPEEFKELLIQKIEAAKEEIKAAAAALQFLPNLLKGPTSQQRAAADKKADKKAENVGTFADERY